MRITTRSENDRGRPLKSNGYCENQKEKEKIGIGERKENEFENVTVCKKKCNISNLLKISISAIILL